ncbi:uncharacterized protein [Ptychodera flava]|uniref:uncharacterized protein n=1 Tax=Ptychodera flava TaxID=63121 RepID=UPI00396A773D
MWRISMSAVVFLIAMHSPICKSSEPVAVEVSDSDARMIGVDCTGKLATRSHVDGDWRLVGGSCCVESVGIMPDGTLLGVGDDFQLYTKKTPNVGDWEGPVDGSCCIIDVAARSDGSIVAVSKKKILLYRADLSSEWVEAKKNTIEMVAVDVFPDGRILGVTKEGGLKVKDGLDVPWKSYKAKGVKVKDISIQPDETVFGVGKKLGSLYVLNEGVWELIPESDCVKSIVSPRDLIVRNDD